MEVYTYKYNIHFCIHFQFFSYTLLPLLYVVVLSSFGVVIIILKSSLFHRLFLLTSSRRIVGEEWMDGWGACGACRPQVCVVRGCAHVVGDKHDANVTVLAARSYSSWQSTQSLTQTLRHLARIMASSHRSLTRTDRGGSV
jgi:hypothetical protein